MESDNHSITKRTVNISQTYHGPIPPAAEMERYNGISSDLPQKIVQMAIDEQKHRFELDKSDLKRKEDELKVNSFLVKMGVIASVFCISIIMSASVLCAFAGHPITSGVIGGGGIAVIVTVFVSGSKIKTVK